jgi:hypothetical protein
MLVFALLPAQTVQAQDTALTDPLDLAHPKTGEPGLWIPGWLQQVELQRKADLKTCTETSANTASTLAERTAEVVSARRANTEQQSANEAVRASLTATSAALEESERVSNARFYWALGSTGAAVVAVLTAVLIEAL